MTTTPAVGLVVLDIAGTTIEEHGAVYRALADAVVSAGGSPSPTDIDAWMGADKHEAVAALLQAGGRPVASAEQVETVYQDFRERLRQAYLDQPPAPLDGVPEALATLRAAGVQVALTTGFTREVAHSLLAMVGWSEGVLDAVVTVDDVAAGRPAPYMIFRAMELTGVRSVGRVLVAGDTTRDLTAGVNAGAAFVVGVLTGGQDAVALGAVRHTHLLHGVKDLPGLVL